jgi:hypothetical protein
LPRITFSRNSSCISCLRRALLSIRMCATSFAHTSH